MKQRDKDNPILRSVTLEEQQQNKLGCINNYYDGSKVGRQTLISQPQHFCFNFGVCGGNII